MHNDPAGMLFYFIASYAFAAWTIFELVTDKQKNPSSQWACLAKFILGPPLMWAMGWIGMGVAVLVSGAVLIGGRVLTIRK